MKNSIIKMAIFTVMLFTFFSCVIDVLASDRTEPTIYANDQVVSQNSGIYVDIYLKDTVNLASLELSIYYDDTISINSHYFSGVGSEFTSVNNEPGVFKLTLLSLEGINGTNHLISLYIQTYNVPIGDYRLDYAIGEAYDVDLKPIIISSSHSKISVKERTLELSKGNIYAYTNENNYKKDELVRYSLQGYNLNQMTSGEIRINYDYTTLSVNEVILPAFFKSNETLYSINNDIQGVVIVVFASEAPVDYLYPVIEVVFKVETDVDSSTEIIASMKNIYNNDLKTIIIDDTSKVINLIKKEVKGVYPNMYLTDYEGNAAEDFIVKVMIEPLSMLAAGEFKVNYDHSLYTVVEVKAGADVGRNGGIIMTNPNVDEGIIAFTYINESGLIIEETLLEMKFKAKNDNQTFEKKMYIEHSGTLVNSSYEKVILDYRSNTVKLFEVVTHLFYDHRGELIKTVKTTKLEEGNIPTPATRLHTTFVEWVKTNDVVNVFEYRPKYSLNQDAISIKSSFKVFDGEALAIEVESNILEMTYEIVSSLMINPNTYDFEVKVYLDNTYQFSIYDQALIIKHTTIGSIADRIKIDDLKSKLNDLKDKDKLLLQEEIDKLTLEYNNYIKAINDEYVVANKIKANMTLYIFIGVFQMMLSVSLWRRYI